MVLLQGFKSGAFVQEFMMRWILKMEMETFSVQVTGGEAADSSPVPPPAAATEYRESEGFLDLQSLSWQSLSSARNYGKINGRKTSTAPEKQACCMPSAL